jgi:hypothetical protein
MTVVQRDSLLYDVGVAKKSKVVVAGIGTIGSFLLPDLIKIGVGRLIFADPDVVKDVNVGVQNYSPREVGLPKVTAMDTIIQPYVRRWQKVNSYQADMNFRSFSDENLRGLALSDPVDYFIDVRTSGNIAAIYTINLRDEADIELYESEWFTDEEADAVRCGARSSLYNSRMAVSIITSQVMKLFASGDEEEHYSTKVFAMSRAPIIENTEPKLITPPEREGLSIFVSAVDTMSGRRDLFDGVKATVGIK